MGNELFIDLSGHPVGALHVFRSAEAPAVGRQLAAASGTTTSSIRRKVTSVSPFSSGRGPLAGSVRTFHGQSGGINHSTASRLGCPWPIILPSLSTRYPRTATILPGTGRAISDKEMWSNSSFNHPLPKKWPGSFSAARRPARYAPRGNAARSNSCTPRVRQITGSPNWAEAENKLGSSSVQLSNAPAGSVISCAFALCCKLKTSDANNKHGNKCFTVHLRVGGQLVRVRPYSGEQEEEQGQPCGKASLTPRGLQSSIYSSCVRSARGRDGIPRCNEDRVVFHRPSSCGVLANHKTRGRLERV